MTIGYLPQDGLALTGRTVFGEAMTVFDDLRQMEKELEELHHRLGELDPRALIRNSGGSAHQIDSESAIVTAMRSKRRWVSCSMASVPQGRLGAAVRKSFRSWQMRLALAKLLLEKPACCCSMNLPTT